MTKFILSGLLVTGLAAVATAQSPAPAPAAPSAPAPAAEAPAEPALPKLDAAQIKLHSSFVLGYRAGQDFWPNFSRYGLSEKDIDREGFLKGFISAYHGQQPEVDDATLQAAMAGMAEGIMKREKELAQVNLEQGKAFLDKNGKRKEVTTTESGLQYEILAAGGNQKYVAPKEGAPEKQFKVHYKGSLIDGSEFDASPEGETVTMDLQVVPGFREALTTMPIGAKWKLFLPSELAYGEERRSSKLGPNSVLVFELELVAIEDAPPAPQGGGFPFPMPGAGQ